MKKWLALPVLLLILSGCSGKTNSESNSSSPDTNKEDDQTILYQGSVVSDGKDTPGQLIIDQLLPVETEGAEPFYESELVLLVTDEVPLIRQSTGEKISLEEIKKGNKIEVRLEKNAPMTRSLPPQIPGMSIKEITVLD